MSTSRNRRLWALAPILAALAASACGGGGGSRDGGADGGGPVRLDAGTPDAGTPLPDAGDPAQQRMDECSAYCEKLFRCGYFPRPGHPMGFSQAACTQQCVTLSFPPQSDRDCVRTAQCTCPDGGASCHTVASCFPSFADGGS